MRNTIFGTLGLLASVTVADFHVTNLINSAGEVGGITTWYTTVTCPSNYYNCNCLTDGDRAGYTASGKGGDPFFAIGPGFCGMPQMNFYVQDDGTYLAYVDGGDGSVVATCYANAGDMGTVCPIWDGSTGTRGGWVCYSYVCN